MRGSRSELYQRLISWGIGFAGLIMIPAIPAIVLYIGSNYDIGLLSETTLTDMGLKAWIDALKIGLVAAVTLIAMFAGVFLIPTFLKFKRATNPNERD